MRTNASSFNWLLSVLLALLLGFALVPVAPVSANVSPATVTVAPDWIDQNARYTVTFTTTEDLAITSDDDIRIRFPAETEVPLAYVDGSISVNGTDVVLGGGIDVDIDGQKFTIDVPKDIAHGTVTVIFKDNAGIVNPLFPGDYTLEVNTSREVTWVESSPYTITGPPGAVDVYLKYQAPIGEGGDIYYVYLESFGEPGGDPTDTPIQDALDFVDDLYMGMEWEGETYQWLLYTSCPAIVDPALVGAKVVVHDGTYEETIVIDTPGVTVESMNGAASTIIDATGRPPQDATPHPAAVEIIAGCVTFDGFTVKNAGVGVVDSPDADSNGTIDARGIYVWPHGEKCEGASIIEIDPETGEPVDEYPCGMGRVNVVNNIVLGSQAGGIQAKDCAILVDGNQVYDNLWDGFVGSGLFTGVVCLDPPDETGASTISGNEFYGNGPSGMGTGYDGWTDAGVEIISTTVSSLVGGGDTLFIVDNDIHDNAHAGIYLQARAADDGVDIRENYIHDNGVFGISNKADADMEPDGEVDVTCQYNDIYGNADWGVKNWVETVDFNAKENYWGTLGGPSGGPEPVPPQEDQRSEALGNGDAVSHHAFYNPWLTVPFATALDDGIRYYGSDTLKLQQGWNALSVPLAIYGPADTFGEVDGLGDFLAVFQGGYFYEGGLWRPITADTELEPGRGYYVLMSDGTRFPVLYSNVLGLPSLDLEAGWNLIGSAFGIDRDDTEGQGRWAVADPDIPEDDEATKTVEEALSSIGDKASNVVSPSVPGQRAIWSCVYPCGMEEMYTGEGYWVFMSSPGTLAGFEITPFYLP